MLRVGEGHAFVHVRFPISLMNRALMIAVDDLDRVAEFYEGHGIPPRFDLAPLLRPPGWNEWMETHDFEIEDRKQMGRRILYGPAATGLRSSPEVQVRPAEPNVSEELLEMMATGFDMPYLRRPTGGEWVRNFLMSASFRTYIAWIDGQRAACAGLAIHEGVGYLGNMTTLPEFRGRGAQGALIAHRIRDAADAGCDAVCSLVAPDSGSERNLKRAGLDKHYDREIWMPKTRWEHPFYSKLG
jgi:GNAT superfamily N-acetyltransferase